MCQPGKMMLFQRFIKQPDLFLRFIKRVKDCKKSSPLRETAIVCCLLEAIPEFLHGATKAKVTQRRLRRERERREGRAGREREERREKERENQRMSMRNLCLELL